MFFVLFFCLVPSEQSLYIRLGAWLVLLLVTIAHRGLLIILVITINSTKKTPCCGTFRSHVLSESVVLDSQLTLTNTAPLAFLPMQGQSLTQGRKSSAETYSLCFMIIIRISCCIPPYVLDILSLLSSFLF